MKINCIIGITPAQWGGYCNMATKPKYQSNKNAKGFNRIA